MVAGTEVKKITTSPRQLEKELDPVKKTALTREENKRDVVSGDSQPL